MARQRRIKFQNPEQGAYHIISRALQKKFIFEEAEKQKLLSLLKWLSQVYFVRVATFSFMTNHIHLIIKMMDKKDISQEELKRRFDLYYNEFAPKEREKILLSSQIPHYYERFSDVSRFVQDFKQRFSRWYNEVHDGFGHVWAERFKSVLLVGPHALRACMLYVDLNALRAGMVREPEKYRYCGLYHYGQWMKSKGTKNSWLDVTLLEEAITAYEEIHLPAEAEEAERIRKTPEYTALRYLTLIYEEGLNLKHGKASISSEVWADKMHQLPVEALSSIYLKRIPHLTNGIILGSKEDCEHLFLENRSHFRTDNIRNATPLIAPGIVSSSLQKSLSSLKELFSIRSTSHRPKA